MESIVRKYVAVKRALDSYVENLGEHVKNFVADDTFFSYLSKLDAFDRDLRVYYKIYDSLVESEPSTSSKNWGRDVYWPWIHCASILVEHLPDNKDLRERFAFLIFNINEILPCAKCRKHYGLYETKNHRVVAAIDEIIYGRVIRGAYDFHAAIADSIAKRDGRQLKSFAYDDFVQWYGIEV